MAFNDLRRIGRGLRARLIYRLDSFVAFPPIVQVVILLVLTAVLVLLWALLVRTTTPGDREIANLPDAVWWSLTHFFDGGTMAGDPWGRRLVSLGATASGVFVISFLTASFASKMAERIRDLRSGQNPVVESGHVLVLGFEPKVVLIAREIARSGQRATLVVLATDDKERIEVAMRIARRVPHSRLKIVVRTGDPRSEQALLRVVADRARSIIVVPPMSLDDNASVQWTLSTLLAVRRAVEETFAGRIIVEARHAEARELLMLAAEAGVAGPRSLSTQIIASDDIIARVLAQSARQDGVYFALRHMLAFNECEIYADELPDRFIGATFDHAHSTIRNAILLGRRAADGSIVLAPDDANTHLFARGDRLIVLASASGAYTFDGVLPAVSGAIPDESFPHQGAECIAVLGFNRTLPYLIRELAGFIAPGSHIRIICGDAIEAAKATLQRHRVEAPDVTVEFIGKDPVEIARTGDELLYSADAVIILGTINEGDDNGDGSALAALLWLRHGMRNRGCSIRRIVTEVRDPRSALHVNMAEHDLIVSTDVVAMLLAQQALDSELAPIYGELLSPMGAAIFVRPRARYAAAGVVTFADVMAGARARGEIAVGLLMPKATHKIDHAQARLRLETGEADGLETVPILMNPRRDTVVPDAPGVTVIVLANI